MTCTCDGPLAKGVRACGMNAACRLTYSVEHGGHLEIVVVVVCDEHEGRRRDVAEGAHGGQRHNADGRQRRDRRPAHARVVVQRRPHPPPRVDARQPEQGRVGARRHVVHQAVLVGMQLQAQLALHLRPTTTTIGSINTLRQNIIRRFGRFPAAETTKPNLKRGIVRNWS